MIKFYCSTLEAVRVSVCLSVCECVLHAVYGLLVFIYEGLSRDQPNNFLTAPSPNVLAEWALVWPRGGWKCDFDDDDDDRDDDYDEM